MPTVEVSPDLVVDARASLGEGPVWDRERGELMWVDIDAGCVHWLEPTRGDTRSLAVGQPVGCAVPRHRAGLALAVRDGFAVTTSDTSAIELVAPLETADPDTRMNDGACDRSGRFWAGTLSAARRPSAALYRWSGDEAPTRVLAGVTTSNGIGWSPDERQMYYVDTATGRVDAFDFDLDAGAIANRRPLVEIERRSGRPDGLAVDADGGIWVALWGGSAVHRYAPDGSLDRRVPLPVTQVTSCCFGDADLGTLYITSAARGVDDPHAGGLFACRPGCIGMPATAFGG